MEFDRCTSLRIGNMYIAHRRRDYAVAKDALHLGQMNSRFKQVRCATVPELRKAVNRDLCAARDGVYFVADREA
jgi:hypothetical protein